MRINSKSEKIKTLSTYTIRGMFVLFSLLATLVFLSIIVLYLADTAYADGTYMGKLMQFLLEIGFLKYIYSNIFIFVMIIPLTFTLVLLFMKRKINKAYNARKGKLSLHLAFLYSLTSVIINIFMLFILLFFLSIFTVFRYVNGMYENNFDKQEGIYTDKVEMIQSHLQDSKAAATLLLDKLMRDVQYDPDYLDGLSNEDYKNFCYEVNRLIVLKDGPETSEEHYFRNNFNRAPETLDKMIETILYDNSDFVWQLCPIAGSIFHMNGKNGEYNLKFVSKDGFFEAVYNKTGELLTAKNDPINMGTFNYADPLTNSAGHNLYDVLPYLIWGNTSKTNEVIDHLDEHIRYDHYENNPDAQARYEKIRLILN